MSFSGCGTNLIVKPSTNNDLSEIDTAIKQNYNVPEEYLRLCIPLEGVSKDVPLEYLITNRENVGKAYECLRRHNLLVEYIKRQQLVNSE